MLLLSSDRIILGLFLICVGAFIAGSAIVRLMRLAFRPRKQPAPSVTAHLRVEARELPDRALLRLIVECPENLSASDSRAFVQTMRARFCQWVEGTEPMFAFAPGCKFWVVLLPDGCEPDARPVTLITNVRDKPLGGRVTLSE